MSLCFPYQKDKVRRPILTLQQRIGRPRPVIAVTIVGLGRSWVGDALVDTGSDDTVFPDSVASMIGIDLTNAPVGLSRTVSPGGVRVRFAMVTLRLATNTERREWDAWVGFTPQLWRPILGYAGFLQFFDATFFGAREELELTVNPTYPGS